MRPEVLSLLHDIHEAGSAILDLSARHTFENYRNERWLRSSIEREFIIVGEAINAALDLDPQIPIKQAREIVGLRNISFIVIDRWTWI